MQIPEEHRSIAIWVALAGAAVIAVGLIQFVLDPGDVQLSLADGSGGTFECRTVFEDWRDSDEVKLAPGANVSPAQRAALLAAGEQWENKCDAKRSTKTALGAVLIAIGAVAVWGAWALYNAEPDPNATTTSLAAPRRDETPTSPPAPTGGPGDQRPPPGWWWDGNRWNPPASE